MPFVAPVAVDPVGLDTKPGKFYNNFPVIQGPFISPTGNQYTILTDQSLVAPKVHAFKSNNKGLTWNEVGVAPAFSPQALIYQSCYDGANSITVIMSDGQAVGNNIVGVVFDLLTDSWGAVSAPAVTAFPAQCYACEYRPSGEVVLLIQESTAVPNNPLFEFMTFNAGVFSAEFDITTNAFLVMVAPTFPNGGMLGANMCVDSTGAVHIFFAWLDNAIDYPLFYQQITPGNALGTFVQLPHLGAGVIDLASFLSNTPLPCVVGNNVIVPLATDTGGGGNPELSIYVGTPLAAPAFTLFSGIDPGITNPGGPGTFDQPAAQFDGTTLRISYTPDFQLIRLCETTDFVTWIFTPSTPFNPLVDKTPPGYNFAGQALVFTLPNRLGIEFRATAPNQANRQRFFQPFILLPARLYFNQNNLPSKALPDPTKPGCN